jgi:hypothetical protein
VYDLLDEVVEIVPALMDDQPIGFECDYGRDFHPVVANREKVQTSARLPVG